MFNPTSSNPSVLKFYPYSPPIKPSAVLYLKITPHHQFSLAIRFLFSCLEIFKLTRFLIFRFIKFDFCT